MSREPIEFNNEFIIKTVVLFCSETRIKVGFDMNVYDFAHAGLLNNKVNFGLRKNNREKFSSSVIDSCIYKRKYTMKKKKQVSNRQVFDTGECMEPVRLFLVVTYTCRERNGGFLTEIDFLARREKQK